MCWKVTFGHHFDKNLWTVRIFWRGQNVLESTHSEFEYEHKLFIFSIEIKRFIVHWVCPAEVPEIRIPVMCKWRGVQIEEYWFAHEFGKEIFFLYREINNPEIKFWVKNMLVASYSRAVIA